MKNEQLNVNHNEHKNRLLGHRFYRRVVLDVDSCLSGIEGIDKLAELHGVGKIVANMTNNTMGGFIPFNVALAMRLELIKPNKSDLDFVSNVYIKNVVEDAQKTIKLLQENEVDVLLLSGGFKDLIIPLANHVGIEEDKVYANKLIFDEKGRYLGFDGKNLLSQKGGKRKQIEKLKNKKKGLFAIVGDGVAEVETAPATDIRIGFGGFVARKRVVEEADVFLTEPTFAPLILLLLDPEKIREIFYEQPENRGILIKAFNSMSGVRFSKRAEPLKQSIIELYDEFVFYSKNLT